MQRTRIVRYLETVARLKPTRHSGNPQHSRRMARAPSARGRRDGGCVTATMEGPVVAAVAAAVVVAEAEAEVAAEEAERVPRGGRSLGGRLGGGRGIII